MSSSNKAGSSSAEKENFGSTNKFNRLTGAENFFIWRVRMLDVLAEKDILYVIETHRPEDPIPEDEADLLITDDYEDDVIITFNPVAPTDAAEASTPSEEATSKAARDAAIAEKQKRIKAHEAYVSYAHTIYESQTKWDRDSRKGISAIRSGCCDGVILRMGTFASAQELWSKLDDAFGQVTIALRHNIKLQMYKNAMQQGESVRKHVDHLKVLREQLAQSGGSISEEDFKFVILFTLPASYELIVNSITAQDDGEPDKNADWVANLLYNNADQLQTKDSLIGGGNSENALAGTATYKGKGKERPKFGKGFVDKRNAPEENEREEGYKKRKGGGKGFTGKMCRCGTGPHPEEKCWYLNPDKASKEVQGAMKEGVRRLKSHKNVQSEAKSPFSLYSTVQRDQTHCEIALVSRYYATVAKQNTTAMCDSSEWIFDSGASAHMCNAIAAFATYMDFAKPREVELGDGYVIPTPGYGTVSLVNNQTEHTVLLSDVLYVPTLQMNLISQRLLDIKGCRTVIEQGVYTVSRNNVELLVGVSYDKNLYTAQVNVDNTSPALHPGARCAALPVQQVDQNCSAKASECRRTLWDWHKVLGHTHLRNIKLLAKSADSGITITGKSDSLVCEACVLGKQHTRKGDGWGKPATQPLELIHIDTDGPWQVGSFRRPGSTALAGPRFPG
jgi:hypothetical protein